MGNSASVGAEYLGPPSWDGEVRGLGFTPRPQVPTRVSSHEGLEACLTQPRAQHLLLSPLCSGGDPSWGAGLTHTGWWWATLSPGPGTRGGWMARCVNGGRSNRQVGGRGRAAGAMGEFRRGALVGAAFEGLWAQLDWEGTRPD